MNRDFACPVGGFIDINRPGKGTPFTVFIRPRPIANLFPVSGSAVCIGRFDTNITKFQTVSADPMNHFYGACEYIYISKI